MTAMRVPAFASIRRTVERQRFSAWTVPAARMGGVRDMVNNLRVLGEAAGPFAMAGTGPDRLPLVLMERAVTETSLLRPADALRRALRLVADDRDWPVGHVYLRRDGDPPAMATRMLFERGERGERGDEEVLEAARELRGTVGPRLAALVMRSREPLWIDDLEAHPTLAPFHDQGVRMLGLFPVMTPQRPVAVLEFLSARPDPPDRELTGVMRVMGTQLGYLIERSNLERRIARLTLQEQQHIAMELHDTVGQEATALGILASMLHQDLERRSAGETELASRLLEGVQQLKVRLRDFVATLRTVDVDPGMLTATLEDLAERYARLGQCVCTADVDDAIEVSDSFAATKIVRIAREAVHNAVLHGKPSRIRVSLSQAPDEAVALEIVDDGSGTDPVSLRSGGLGQEIMRYGADLLSADLQVQAQPGGGVRVRCIMPAEALRSDRGGEETR
jgi:signal transduction histidine kinase